MSNSVLDINEPFLDRDHEEKPETRLTARQKYRTISVRDLILISSTALISIFISILVTVALSNSLPDSLRRNPTKQSYLPALDLPPLGNSLRIYEGEPSLYGKNFNTTREAWMALFPSISSIFLVLVVRSDCILGGMGYVSMNDIKAMGDVPDIIQQMSTDGSGRFCVAAFHQLHCLVIIFRQFCRI